METVVLVGIGIVIIMVMNLRALLMERTERQDKQLAAIREELERLKSMMGRSGTEPVQPASGIFLHSLGLAVVVCGNSD